MSKKQWILRILLAIMVGITLALYIQIVEAADKPLPYPISAPNVTQKKNTVLIEWRQTESVLVTVYKLSWTRKLKNNCSGVETFGANCVVLWQKAKLVGNIRVTDKAYKKGDEYYIQQNVYQTHNGGYGPFIPTNK